MTSTTAHTVEEAQAPSWSFSAIANNSNPDSDSDKASDDANAEPNPDTAARLIQVHHASPTIAAEKARKLPQILKQVTVMDSRPQSPQDASIASVALTGVDFGDARPTAVEADTDRVLTAFKDFPAEFYHDDGLRQEDPNKRFPHEEAREKFEARQKAARQGKSPPRFADDEDALESPQSKRIRMLEDSLEDCNNDQTKMARGDTPMAVGTAGKSLFGGGDDSDGLGDPSPSNAPIQASLFGSGGSNGSPKMPIPSHTRDGRGSDASHKQGDISPKEGIRERISTLNLEEGEEEEENEEEEVNGGEAEDDERDPEEEDNDEQTDDGFASDSEETSHRTSYSPSRSFSPCARPQINPEPYLLRNNIDRNITGSFIDADDTGNYDPEVEARMQRIKAKEARERRKEIARKREAEKKTAKQRPKLIMRFDLGRCFGTVLSNTDGRDNSELFPPDYGVLDSENERLEQVRQKRWKGQPQSKIPDPAEEVDDLTGWPEARGCKSCRRRGGVECGVDCSAIATGKFPCDECNIEDVFCEPILPPRDPDGQLLKGKCNHCTLGVDEDEDNYCSFEQPGLAPHKVCHQCDKAGYGNCIPGVPEGYVAKRIDIDQIAYGPDRPCVDCMACCTKGVKCSVKTKRGKGPCKACQKEGIACWFWELPSDSKGKGRQSYGKKVKAPLPSNGGESRTAAKATSLSAAAAKKKAEEDADARLDACYDDSDSTPFDFSNMARSPTPEFELEDAFGNKGVVTEIHTSFAHPIKFNENILRSGLDCNFCSQPLFGFTGHMEREVDVIRWHSGLGYTELQGGHREDQEETIMCVACTNTRLQIIGCDSEGHQFASIPGMLPGQAPDFQDAVMLLASADPMHPGEVQRQLERWCSLCFSVATIRCYKEQPDLAQDEVRLGCGLALCDRCHRCLETEYSSVDVMAKAWDQKPKVIEGQDDVEGAVRADVGFLQQDSLLLKNAMVDRAEEEDVQYDDGVGQCPDDGDGFGCDQSYANPEYFQASGDLEYGQSLEAAPSYPVTGGSFFRERYAPATEPKPQHTTTSPYGLHQYGQGNGMDWM